MIRITGVSASLTLLLFTNATLAQESRDVHPHLTTDWWIDVGAYYPTRKFTLSADGEIVGDNVEHEFDQQLGLSDRDPLFEGQIGWQFGEKWGVAAQYFKASRNSSATLEEDIEWEDVVGKIVESAGLMPRP